ncbi:acetolactate synthase small subunit [Psychromonas sp. 14N.309.X.WAT.B.A12]|jgi:acetolactate synthase I/III small subunit|uniref:acetolactate synthase small subunit n=1 Tax=unclassified Psychromonas TaxID=2614957 RepID=UPI0025AF484E|nr:acetolactate synthase small subunit [Psychromonas sp. 14N.309.X.WAT.B.A12]MDN2664360.1 acetolactate synthase small subunit [Psychromonas sp. 14N.309.X.WAT.B.A12]
MRRIISVLIENESGSLARVVGLFAQRGYNIESLTVSPTNDNTLSRMTITTDVVDNATLEQMMKQLHKLVDVLRVSELTQTPHVERELLLLKVRTLGSEAREEVKRTSDIYRGQIVDITQNLYTIQLTGAGAKLDAFVATMDESSEIVEMVRSGVCGIARGDKSLRA